MQTHTLGSTVRFYFRILKLIFQMSWGSAVLSFLNVFYLSSKLSSFCLNRVQHISLLRARILYLPGGCFSSSCHDEYDWILKDQKGCFVPVSESHE